MVIPAISKFLGQEFEFVEDPAFLWFILENYTLFCLKCYAGLPANQSAHMITNELWKSLCKGLFQSLNDEIISSQDDIYHYRVFLENMIFGLLREILSIRAHCKLNPQSFRNMCYEMSRYFSSTMHIIASLQNWLTGTVNKGILVRNLPSKECRFRYEKPFYFN